MSNPGYIPDNYGVVFDESENQLYYGKNGRTPINIGSGTTPTWQQTLIQGSQLSQDNTVDQDSFQLQFVGGDYENQILPYHGLVLLPNGDGIYMNVFDGTHSLTLNVSSTRATLSFDGGAQQVIATETLASGTFTTADAQIVTVVNGIITVITN